MLGLNQMIWLEFMHFMDGFWIGVLECAMTWRCIKQYTKATSKNAFIHKHLYNVLEDGVQR